MEDHRQICEPLGIAMLLVSSDSWSICPSSSDVPPVPVRRLSHIGIKVNDLDRSIDFYVRVLGFRLEVDQRGGVLAGHETVIGIIGDVAIELICDATRPSDVALDPDGVGFSCLSFSVHDLEDARRALLVLGIDATPPIQFPQGRVCFFRDPDENLLELIELPKGATALAQVVSART